MRPRTLCLLVLGGTLVLARSAHAATPAPLPWDNTLSMRVSHSGLWFSHATQEELAAEIEDALAAYQPAETMVNSADDFGDHQINTPLPPPGWTFYEPANPEDPMQLHVVVQDAQNRLGSVVVTNADTGAQIGTINAHQQGSLIDGTVNVATSLEQVNLTVKNTGGATLVKAAALNPRVVMAIPVIVSLGWLPNHGQQHPCPYANPLAEPYGDPNVWHNHPATESPTLSNGCCGPRVFENDNPTVALMGPTYPLLNKKVARDAAGTGANLSPEARTAVHAAISEAKAPFLGGTSVIADYQAPPFSRGTAHWPVRLIGECNVIVYFPYKGRQSWIPQVTVALGAYAAAHRGAGVGSTDPANPIAAAISVTIGQVTKQYQVSGCAPAGQVWGLRAEATSPPTAMPLQNITAPVTVNLKGDIVPPEGGTGPIAGTGQAIKLEALVEPPPPPPASLQLALSFGNPVGTCVVELGKGWKWKMEATPQGPYTAPAPFEVLMPGPGVVDLVAHLNATIQLRIYTTNQQVQPAGATVVFQRRAGTNPETWVEQVRGQSTRQQDGTYCFIVNMLPQGNLYRAAALNPMTGQPGPWALYESLPCVQAAITCTVPQGGGSGGGG